jgi:putative transcriptional regulator
MNDPRHHIPEPMMAAYVAGTLSHPYALVIATHISMCDECRARHETHLSLGGAVMQGLAGREVSGELRANVLAMLDDAPEERPVPVAQSNGIYPAPLSGLMGPEGPRWKKLGTGSKQSILWNGPEGSVRLIYIPANQAVPEHTHRGLELTLVLQGSFSDEDGTFGAGDLEVADQEVEHTPIAGPDEPCICVAATDAPLRFNAFLPRMLQPILNI